MKIENSAMKLLIPVLWCHRLLEYGLFIMLLFVAFSVQAETLNLTITGVVISSSCTLMPEDQNLHVDMGSIDAQQLEETYTSDIKNFNIRLEKCDASVSKNATVTFDGNSNGTSLDLTTPMGFGLMFLDKNGHLIRPGVPAESIALQSGDNTLSFGVQAIVRKDEGVVVKGAFSALATVKIEYQ
ncbi:fimbrial protein [Aeromonas piscicola]|uniref:fimbrial protein n=1 Tax=Aeromonas piscicola TaxID=600645 RepID=UPI0021F9168C|nr:fimbrial protein [Aeromonas piscicola]MCW0507631.1 type 1 fimbrial protein [Aeromonas piscicola]